MKNYYPELMTTAILLIGACAVVFALATRNSEEVEIYMDPENNVVCYYTKHNMQCFTYTDEGTHLQLN